ncbi:MAG: hypothetical protein ACYDH9_00025 [Limisphaerales bacterium]
MAAIGKLPRCSGLLVEQGLAFIEPAGGVACFKIRQAMLRTTARGNAAAGDGLCASVGWKNKRAFAPDITRRVPG